MLSPGVLSFDPQVEPAPYFENRCPRPRLTLDLFLTVEPLVGSCDHGG